VIPHESGIAYVDIISSVMELIMKERLRDKTAQESVGDYVSAVLSNNRVQANLISKRLGIASANLHGICVFSDVSGPKRNNAALALSEQFSHKLKELGIAIVSSVVDNRIIFLLFVGSKKKSAFSAFRDEYTDFTNEIVGSNVIIFSYFSEHRRAALGDIYLDFCKAVETLPLIFPYRNGFDSYSVQFTLSCTHVIQSHREFFNESRLYSLLDELDNEEMLKTLSIYMLDSNMSSSEAAKLLYVHTNTILYRIHKIKEKLHLTLADTSEINSLCAALAIRRILQNSV
jgi:sugar diacid utilization regulator